MSVSGKVISVSPDWRGSVLAVATTTGTTVLTVDDATDFDEDGGWLVISDETTPREYLSVDPDAETITLAAAVGAVFDDTQPVVVWDPDVFGGGARVREDVAMVMLTDSEQAVLATLKHEQIPTAGIDFLIGATVLLEDEDGDDATTDWYVASVLGREATLDSALLVTPYVRAYLAADVSIPHATLTPITGLTVASSQQFGPWSPDASGWFRADQAGIYQVVVTASWQPNGTGARYTQIQILDYASVATTVRQVAFATVAGATMSSQAVALLNLPEGYWIRGVVQQTSGAALNLAGSAAGQLTAIEISKVAAP